MRNKTSQKKLQERLQHQRMVNDELSKIVKFPTNRVINQGGKIAVLLTPSSIEKISETLRASQLRMHQTNINVFPKFYNDVNELKKLRRMRIRASLGKHLTKSHRRTQSAPFINVESNAGDNNNIRSHRSTVSSRFDAKLCPLTRKITVTKSI